MKILAALTGCKTYALSMLAVAAIGAGMATGKVPVIDGVAAITAAAGLATNRAGSKADTAKVTATMNEARDAIDNAHATIAGLAPWSPPRSEADRRGRLCHRGGGQGGVGRGSGRTGCRFHEYLMRRRSGQSPDMRRRMYRVAAKQVQHSFLPIVCLRETIAGVRLT